MSQGIKVQFFEPTGPDRLTLDPALLGPITLEPETAASGQIEPLLVWLCFALVATALILVPLFQHYFSLKAQKRSLARAQDDAFQRYQQEVLLDTQAEREDFERLLNERAHTVQSLEIKVNEAHQSLHSYERSLHDAQARLERSEPLLARSDFLRTALDDMEAIWLDERATRDNCRILLQTHSWVLEPDYTVARFDREQSLDQLVAMLFDDRVSGIDGAAVNRGLRIDLCGWSSGFAGLQPGRNGHVLLLVHVMRPGESISRGHMQDAYIQCTSLLNLAQSELWGKPIDCLVVAGDIDADANDLDLRFGGNAHGSVRVIPITYTQLVYRAQGVARLLLGDPVDTAETDARTAGAAFGDGLMVRDDYDALGEYAFDVSRIAAAHPEDVSYQDASASQAAGEDESAEDASFPPQQAADGPGDGDDPDHAGAIEEIGEADDWAETDDWAEADDWTETGDVDDLSVDDEMGARDETDAVEAPPNESFDHETPESSNTATEHRDPSSNGSQWDDDFVDEDEVFRRIGQMRSWDSDPMAEDQKRELEPEPERDSGPLTGETDKTVDPTPETNRPSGAPSLLRTLKKPQDTSASQPAHPRPAIAAASAPPSPLNRDRLVSKRGTQNVIPLKQKAVKAQPEGAAHRASQSEAVNTIMSLSQRLARTSAEQNGTPLKPQLTPKRWR